MFGLKGGWRRRKPVPSDSMRDNDAAGHCGDSSQAQPPLVDGGDSHRRPSTRLSAPALPASVEVIPTLTAMTTKEHAVALLEWLQGPGGRTGTVLASELMEIHRELCAERNWEPKGWAGIGRELRRMLGHGKEYIGRGNDRQRAYRIPPRVAAPVAPAALTRAA